MTLYNC